MNETQRHEVNAGRDTELEVRDVFRRQRCRWQPHAGSIDAFVLPQYPSIDDRRPNVAVAGILHAQLDSPVVEQQCATRFGHSRKLGVGGRHAAGFARIVADDDVELVTRLERERGSAAQRAGTDFGPERSCSTATMRPCLSAAARIHVIDCP